MSLNIQDHPEGVVRARFRDREILAYNYLNADVRAEEVPKPYFHPLRTLQGSIVTLCRPNDHPWHKGIGMTLTKVGDANFWGGGTYRQGNGYTWIRNHGRQRHVRWLSTNHRGHEANWKQEIAWEDAEGCALLKETRGIILKVTPAESCWTLDLEMEIVNEAQTPLRLGNYESSEGLQGSFYTGLFWRLPREFLDPISTFHYKAEAAVFCENCPKNDETVHGKPARWIALHGSVDTIVDPVTVALIDRSPAGMSNPRAFVRKNMVAVSLPFQGPDDLALPPGGHLKLNYRILIADGHWPEDRLRAFCEEAVRTS